MDNAKFNYWEQRLSDQAAECERNTQCLIEAILLLARVIQEQASKEDK